MSEQIRLTNMQGIARKSGTDQYGNAWIEFEVDKLAEQTTGECSICGMTIYSGWLCLDGGEEVCDEHVTHEEAN